MIFSATSSHSGFTLGTYAAQDYDLSEAEKAQTPKEKRSEGYDLRSSESRLEIREECL